MCTYSGINHISYKMMAKMCSKMICEETERGFRNGCISWRTASEVILVQLCMGNGGVPDWPCTQRWNMDLTAWLGSLCSLEPTWECPLRHAMSRARRCGFRFHQQMWMPLARSMMSSRRTEGRSPGKKLSEMSCEPACFSLKIDLIVGA